MIETGWELPAGGQARTVAEILQAPASPEERRQLRREEAAAEERRAEVADIADAADTVAFRALVNGTPPRDVLAGALAEPFRDREESARRRRARDILREHGLADVLGASSGAVFDPHLGILEPAPDVAQRARMDYEYEAARAEVEASSRRRAVDRYRERLDERYRARFR